MSGGLICVRNVTIPSINISSNVDNAVSKLAIDAGDIGYEDTRCGQWSRIFLSTPISGFV